MQIKKEFQYFQRGPKNQERKQPKNWPITTTHFLSELQYLSKQVSQIQTKF